jgi:aminopeptidase N
VFLRVSALLIACSACSSPGPVELPEASANPERDLLQTSLHFDVEARTGLARIRFAGDDSLAATLDVGDLVIRSVTREGEALNTRREGKYLDIGIPETDEPIEIQLEYDFQSHEGFEGFRTQGSTLTWPTWCGNLFPCKSNPADGATFELDVQGVPDGLQAIYPATTSADAPSYMVAFALGDYSELDLGQTGAGTRVKAYYLPGGQSGAEVGTEFLSDYVDFFERTYGPYPFGDTIASVAVNWGFGAAGGIEHHPYFHVASGAMSNHEIQAHEVAHGWFGNGVRMRCWEDLVLSEGVAQYLTLRAIEEAEGVAAADALWATIQSRLDTAVARADTIAYPDGCNEIDILTHPLWSRIPYEKGAFFLRAVEERAGRAPLDAALATFFEAHVGQATTMQSLLDSISSETQVNIDDLVEGWLRSLGVPDSN